jgi:hypothetical protein
MSNQIRCLLRRSFLLILAIKAGTFRSAYVENGYTLMPDETLTTGEWLESSNGQYRFYLQGDCNLVLGNQQTGEALWASGTNGQGGTRLVLQRDGNLVLYTATMPRRIRMLMGLAIWTNM